MSYIATISRIDADGVTVGGTHDLGLTAIVEVTVPHGATDASSVTVRVTLYKRNKREAVASGQGSTEADAFASAFRDLADSYGG